MFSVVKVNLECFAKNFACFAVKIKLGALSVRCGKKLNVLC